MNNKRWDALYLNAAIATFEGAEAYGLRTQAALAVKAGRIDWLGNAADLPGSPSDLSSQLYDLKGKCITPGLIDCHTHLVYAGNRCKEFELRLQGASYEQIARAGGGIRSTVQATRAASEEELFQQSLKRARAMLTCGVTTLEIKSGYGLDLANELKMLRVAKRIGEELPMTVSLTFLGAHALPPEFAGQADQYIDLVCNEMIPVVAEEGLAQSVDVFCEKIAFNLEQTQRVFETAKKYNLGIKCHAEQLSDSGSAALAAQYLALSVDHLEFLSEKSVDAMARAGCVAVLLPGAFYFLRETQLPPIDLLRQYKVPMAIATDCNPGTSPVTSLLLMINMACTLFRLTPEEALRGVTCHAAQALGLFDSIGSLSVGKFADFVVWDVQHPAELAYQIGMNSSLTVVKKGRVVLDNNC
ncbi:MAG: imidazolonepropionase [Gammaproteobacteria bacterium]